MMWLCAAALNYPLELCMSYEAARRPATTATAKCLYTGEQNIKGRVWVAAYSSSCHQDPVVSLQYQCSCCCVNKSLYFKIVPNA